MVNDVLPCAGDEGPVRAVFRRDPAVDGDEKRDASVARRAETHDSPNGTGIDPLKFSQN